MTPFFNAAIQGVDKIARTFKERPRATTLKAMVALTLPAVWCWWKYKDEDYMRFAEIWIRGINELHKRIGLPVDEATEPNEDYREHYYNNADNHFVIEDEGLIVGGGGIDGNMIGSLAIDTNFYNHGYGTSLAIFLTNEILRRGNKEAYLHCETGNDNAFHVYEKIGFRKLYKVYWSVKNFTNK
jgi:ribosomal protein S18 acetylase RimI-like enzyme